MKLLYAEDEKMLSDAVCDVLRYHKYLVDAVYNGQDALDYALNDDYDVIILDIMMPKMDGLMVLKELRQHNIASPILLLTAKTEIEDQVKGLDLGADDYIAKPFAMDLLLAHIRALLRRKEEFVPNLLTFGNITLNQITYELSNDKESITLSKIEYQVMELLMLNQGIYLSSEDILIKVWGYDSDAEIGTVWVYISYLRKKLLALNADITISAKRNRGYRLERENDD